MAAGKLGLETTGWLLSSTARGGVSPGPERALAAAGADTEAKAAGKKKQSAWTGACSLEGGAARLYLRRQGSAGRSLEEVWRPGRVSQPSRQLPGTTGPGQLLFLLSVPVVLSRATTPAAAATLRRQHISTPATAAANAYFTSRDV